MRKILYNRPIIRIFLSTLLMVFSFSCDDFVKVDSPKEELPRDIVFNDDANALAAINGLYSNMISEFTGFASGGITFYAGLAADELQYYVNDGSDESQFFTNSIDPRNSKNEVLWSNAYNYIYHANAILEGISLSNKLTPQVKSRVKGEAEFVRAFVYFYLVNLYGDLPLVLTTDYLANAGLPRSTKDQIYQQIVADLLSAQTLPDYGERIRPNKWVAVALLARVYLYTEKWVEAEAQATTLINNTALFTLESDLERVFDTKSKEAIWQMKQNIPWLNTWDGYNFIPLYPPANVTMSNKLMETFEPDDLRKTWIGTLLNDSDSSLYYFPYKYKEPYASVLKEHYMVFRLAEQYLIRAEARAQQDNLAGAITDLNAIRERAGLPDIDPDISNQDLLLAIEKERQTELFAEWGHRWFDLKRTKGINDKTLSRAVEVLSTVKDEHWQPTDILFPIPFRDTQNDRELRQNPGYF
jgi:hypothetical protein